MEKKYIIQAMCAKLGRVYYNGLGQWCSVRRDALQYAEQHFANTALFDMMNRERALWAQNKEVIAY